MGKSYGSPNRVYLIHGKGFTLGDNAVMQL